MAYDSRVTRNLTQRRCGSQRIGDGLVGHNSLISVSGINLNLRCGPIFRSIDSLILSVAPFLSRSPKVAMENVAVIDGHLFVPRDLNDALSYDGAVASALFRVIVKANLAVPGTITSWLPRLGNLTDSCCPGPIVHELWVKTMDCRTPLTPRGSRRDL